MFSNLFYLYSCDIENSSFCLLNKNFSCCGLKFYPHLPLPTPISGRATDRRVFVQTLKCCQCHMDMSIIDCLTGNLAGSSVYTLNVIVQSNLITSGTPGQEKRANETPQDAWTFGIDRRGPTRERCAAESSPEGYHGYGWHTHEESGLS